MTSKALSQLTELTELTGTELFYSDSGSADVSVTADTLRTFSSPVVSVKRYGAVGDSTNGSNGTDDTIAVQAALNSGNLIYFPSGGYRITSAVMVSNFPGAGIVGDGPEKTIIYIQSEDALGVTVDVFAEKPRLTGFKVKRIGTPTSSAHNINVTGSTNQCLIRDVVSEGGYRGFNLGVGVGYLEQCIADSNYSDGFYMAGQWGLINSLALFNEGIGARYVADNATVSPNSIIGFNTFANTGGGIWFEGSGSGTIEGIRMTNCFLGEDGNHEVHINASNTTPHVLTNIWTELAGQAATGIGQLTAASNTGSGFRITALPDNTVSLVNCVSQNQAGFGLITSATKTIVIGGEYSDNTEGGGAGAGLYIAGPSIVHGVCCRNNTYGIVVDGANECTISGNDLTGNVQAVQYSSSGALNVLRDNEGFNPVGASAIVVGASPFTHTAGPSPQTVYIRAGTVSDVSTGGQTIFTATGCTVHLEPNESVVVTYSVTPTMIKSIH